MRYCSRCDKNFEAKDAGDHRVCKRNQPVTSVATDHVATTPVATKRVATLSEVEQKVLKKALLKSVEVKHPKAGETSRVQKWREANRERYNKRMKEYRAARKSGKKPLGIAYG